MALTDMTERCGSCGHSEKDTERLRAHAASLEVDKYDLVKLLDNERLALAATQAELLAAREALYALVVGCLLADANEDAPEFVNGEAERGRDALPKCGRCGGCGALDGVEYVDVVIPEAVRCPDCGGWGFVARVLGESQEGAKVERTEGGE